MATPPGTAPLAVRVGRRIGREALALVEHRVLAPRGLRLVREDAQHVLDRGYHSPVPELADLPGDLFDRASPMPGVDWPAAPGLDLLQGPLGPLLSEYAPPELPGVPDAERASLLHFYEGLDGAALHALLRHVRPSRVVELGSGVSTLVAVGALRRNAADGAPAALEVYDPFPRRPTSEGLGEHGTLHPVAAERVPAEVFAALGAGDVLFVDTTHVVRTGGDVVRILLDVLPTLAPGVLVHVHDVLLPYEYHRAWLQNGWFWSEQYLVQGVLQGNPAWEVVLANHQLHREHEDELLRAVPAHRPGMKPSGLWIRRRIDGETGSLADRLRAPRD